MLACTTTSASSSVSINPENGCPAVDAENQTVLRRLIRENVQTAVKEGTLDPAIDMGRIFVCDPERWVKEHHPSKYVADAPLDAKGNPNRYIWGLMNSELEPLGFKVCRVEPNLGLDNDGHAKQYGWDVIVRKFPKAQNDLPLMEGEHGVSASREMLLFGIQALESSRTGKVLENGSIVYPKTSSTAFFIREADQYNIEYISRMGKAIDAASARELVELLGDKNISFCRAAVDGTGGPSPVTQFKVRTCEALQHVISLLEEKFGEPMFTVRYPLRVAD